MSPLGILDALAEGVAVGVAISAVTVAMSARYHPMLFCSAPPIALVWAALRLEDPRRKRIRWDAWGVSEEGAEARVALAWRDARARIERSALGAVAVVRDGAGRTIRVSRGIWAPRGLARDASWAVDRDFEAFASAIGHLPRDAAETSAPSPIWRLISGAWALPFALLLAVWVRSLRGPSGLLAVGPVFIGAPVALAIACLSLPLLLTLASLIAQLGRTLAMRRARWARVTGSIDALRLANDDGTSTPLVLVTPHSDARMGERGHPVRVLLDTERTDAGPYRGSETARARDVETRNERARRLRMLLTSGARASLGMIAIAGIASSVAGYDPYANVQAIVPAVVTPRPPPPTAWPIAPRPPEEPHARRGRAPLEGPRGGYALRRADGCPLGADCPLVLTVWDTGEEIVCDEQGQRRCAQFTRGR